jgi:linoleate 10R-lipoxygenase
MPSPKVIAAAGMAKPPPALAYEMRLTALLGDVQPDRALVDDILFSTDSLQRWGDAFAETTLELVKTRSVYNAVWKTRHVDVIREVINLVPIRFLANEILGLPLKTETNEGGVYRDADLYSMFRDISE